MDKIHRRRKRERERTLIRSRPGQASQCLQASRFSNFAGEGFGVVRHVSSVVVRYEQQQVADHLTRRTPLRGPTRIHQEGQGGSDCKTFRSVSFLVACTSDMSGVPRTSVQ